jgi:hypothetical protein
MEYSRSIQINIKYGLSKEETVRFTTDNDDFGKEIYNLYKKGEKAGKVGQTWPREQLNIVVQNWRISKAFYNSLLENAPQKQKYNLSVIVLLDNSIAGELCSDIAFPTVFELNKQECSDDSYVIKQLSIQLLKYPTLKILK